MNNLTALQRDLLYLISGLDNPDTQALRASLEEYYVEDMRQDRLYPNMNTLVEKGLITKKQQGTYQDCYRITRRGRQEIKDHREWEHKHYER